MPLRRNRNINDVYERIMARMKERLDQFIDQFANQMNYMMNPRRRGDRNGDGVTDDNYEKAPVFDDDPYEEEIVSVEVESMPVYDTEFEDVIGEEEGFVRKGGFCGEEDNIENVVVVASDHFSSMIQTTFSVDFSKTINSNPHKLIWFQKGNFVEVSILIGKKYQEEYLKAAPMDDKLGFKTIKVRGRVIIKKGNLMQGIQIWMLQVQGTSEANSRTSFFKWGRMMRGE
ncbi:hypothetical protein Tco_1423928 [Tanacetum coccineum]